MHIESTPRRRHGIGLTPLIDVVFILLVFFMLATSFTDWRPIALATGTGAPAAHDKPPAVVQVAAGGALRYRDRTLPATRLAGELKAARERGDISAVIVSPAADASLDVTVNALDALTGAGVAPIALATGRRADSAP